MASDRLVAAFRQRTLFLLLSFLRMRIRSLLLIAAAAVAPAATVAFPAIAQARPCRNVPGYACCTEAQYNRQCFIVPYRR
jgi:hypothetical protein